MRSTRTSLPALVAACAAALATASALRAQSDPRQISIPVDLSGSPGGVVTVPVLIDTAADVVAIDLELAFDEQVLEFAGARPGAVMEAPAGDVLISTRLREAGGDGLTVLRVSLIRLDAPEVAAGALAEIDFGVRAEVAPGTTTPLELRRGSLNEDRMISRLASGLLTISSSTVFHRGDANDDGREDISDTVFIVGFLFLGGPTTACREAANANGHARVDISDAIFIVTQLFLGGPPPPDPGPPPAPCGPDPTGAGEVDLGCDRYDSCI